MLAEGKVEDVFAQYLGLHTPARAQVSPPPEGTWKTSLPLPAPSSDHNDQSSSPSLGGKPLLTTSTVPSLTDPGQARQKQVPCHQSTGVCLQTAGRKEAQMVSRPRAPGSCDHPGTADTQATRQDHSVKVTHHGPVTSLCNCSTLQQKTLAKYSCSSGLYLVAPIISLY